MVKEISLKNLLTNQELVLKEDEAPLILDSVDWGSPVVSFNNYRVPHQIGETVSGVMIGTREIIISGYVIADPDKLSDTGIEWSEYLKQQERLIEQAKDGLNRVISVYQDMSVIVGEYHIEGRPEQPVKYSSNYRENNEVMCLFEITLLCYDPMFKRGSTLVELSSFVNKFYFPLIIPEDEGMIFGEVFPQTAALVDNTGNVPVGCKIVMQAHGGSVKNPKILNVNTGEFMGFEGVTLYDGESVVINTAKGEEYVIKRTGTGEHSLIGNIINGSTFLQINVGSQYYFYDMDGSELNLYTTIEFSENYFGLAVM